MLFMRKKMIAKRMMLFLVFGLTGCGNSSNSNMAVWSRPTPTPSPVAAVSPTIEAAPSIVPSPTPQNSPSPTPTIPLPADEPPPNDTKAVVVSPGKLLLPVAGIKPTELRDTFKDARSEGRVHDAIDIMAAAGTPIFAAADGEIARFFDSERGGITIYQYSADKKLIYYYAHLQRRADNLKAGDVVKQGTIIGYVGDTGNAGAGNTHLHFAIWTIDDPKRFWEGTNINPYPLLK